jgi:hypothetical protein
MQSILEYKHSCSGKIDKQKYHLLFNSCELGPESSYFIKHCKEITNKENSIYLEHICQKEYFLTLRERQSLTLEDQKNIPEICSIFNCKNELYKYTGILCDRFIKELILSDFENLSAGEIMRTLKQRIQSYELGQIFDCSHLSINLFMAYKDMCVKHNHFENSVRLEDEYMKGEIDCLADNFDKELNKELNKEIKTKDKLAIPTIIEFTFAKRESLDYKKFQTICYSWLLNKFPCKVKIYLLRYGEVVEFTINEVNKTRILEILNISKKDKDKD